MNNRLINHQKTTDFHLRMDARKEAFMRQVEVVGYLNDMLFDGDKTYRVVVHDNKYEIAKNSPIRDHLFKGAVETRKFSKTIKDAIINKCKYYLYPKELLNLNGIKPLKEMDRKFFSNKCVAALNMLTGKNIIWLKISDKDIIDEHIIKIKIKKVLSIMDAYLELFMEKVEVDDSIINNAFTFLLQFFLEDEAGANFWFFNLDEIWKFQDYNTKIVNYIDDKLNVQLPLQELFDEIDIRIEKFKTNIENDLYFIIQICNETDKSKVFNFCIQQGYFSVEELLFFDTGEYSGEKWKEQLIDAWENNRADSLLGIVSMAIADLRYISILPRSYLSFEKTRDFLMDAYAYIKKKCKDKIFNDKYYGDIYNFQHYKYHKIIMYIREVKFNINYLRYIYGVIANFSNGALFDSTKYKCDTYEYFGNGIPYEKYKYVNDEFKKLNNAWSKDYIKKLMKMNFEEL